MQLNLPTDTFTANALLEMALSVKFTLCYTICKALVCWRDELHASFNYFISFVRMVVGLGLDRCASGRERTR